jgi:glycosyltransferase involved in cell wall biosynthesis
MTESSESFSDTEQETSGEDVQLKVVVGIPAYNSERILAKTIAAFKGSVDEIIVCDNASTDGTSQTAESLGCKVISLPLRSDDAIALNSLLGASLESKADALIVLDQSCRIDKAGIEKLVRSLVVQSSDIVVGTSPNGGRVELQSSPIKAYSRNAVSKMFFSNVSKLSGATKLGLQVTKCELSSSSFAPKQQPSKRAAGTVQVTSVPFVPQETTSEEEEKEADDTVSEPPRKVASPKKTFDERNEHQQSLLRPLMKNLWFQRSLILISGMVASVLLLTYSVVFWYKVQVLGATTSVFPWLWYVYYIKANPGAMTAFVSGLTVSIVALVACGIVLFKWVLPELEISVAVLERKRAKVLLENPPLSS